MKSADGFIDFRKYNTEGQQRCLVVVEFQIQGFLLTIKFGFIVNPTFDFNTCILLAHLHSEGELLLSHFVRRPSVTPSVTRPSLH